MKSHYRIPSIHIHLKIGGNNITYESIENYKNNKPTHEKDIDFLVYDLDVPGLIERLRKNDSAILLVSNPCIELWLLLHYKNQTAHINSEKCCREMNNRNRAYKKGFNDERLKKKLTDKIKEACNRAKALNKYKNPSSTIFKLIEKLEEAK